MKERKRYYKKLLEERKFKKKYLKNGLFAFIFGGIISLLGQILIEVFKYFKFEEKESVTLMLMTIIFLAILLSAFGIYDKIGQVARCGTIIPISGFANSMASSSMEYKPEGFILGVGANTFKLAGTVVVFGVFSAFIVATIKYLVFIL
jgi:stage V sporulation protein AC